MRRRWSMSGPNAFSMRRAISGVSAALPCSRSESVARRTFKISAAFETLRPSASIISVLIKSPGCGGFFMGISSSLVIIDQVNVADSIRFFVVTKNQPSVSGDSQAPQSLQVAFKRMQLPSGKPAELFQRLGGLHGQQKLEQLVSHRGRYASSSPVLIKLPYICAESVGRRNY